MGHNANVPPERLPQVSEGCSLREKEVVGCDNTFIGKAMDEGYDIQINENR